MGVERIEGKAMTISDDTKRVLRYSPSALTRLTTFVDQGIVSERALKRLNSFCAHVEQLSSPSSATVFVTEKAVELDWVAPPRVNITFNDNGYEIYVDGMDDAVGVRSFTDLLPYLAGTCRFI